MELSIWDVVQFLDAIMVCRARVLVEGGEDMHAIVWDGWRRVLFVGPGDFHGSQVTGTILVTEDDIHDRNHIDSYQEQTLTDYVATVYGITHIVECKALLVTAARSHTTHHI